jgi:hypothetical protein
MFDFKKDVLPVGSLIKIKSVVWLNANPDGTPIVPRKPTDWPDFDQLETVEVCKFNGLYSDLPYWVRPVGVGSFMKKYVTNSNIGDGYFTSVSTI